MGSYAAAKEVGEFYAGDIMQKLGIERKNKPKITKTLKILRKKLKINQKI